MAAAGSVAIKQTRGGEPLLREQHCPGVAVLIAALPAAAMDPEHRRRGGAVALLGEEDVHQQRLAPTGAIPDIGDDGVWLVGRLPREWKGEKKHGAESQPHRLN